MTIAITLFINNYNFQGEWVDAFLFGLLKKDQLMKSCGSLLILHFLQHF